MMAQNFASRCGAVALAALGLLLPSQAPAQATRPGAADASDLRAAVALESARPPAPTFERKTFLAQPVLRSAVLSPDGSTVAFLREQGASRGVWLQPTTGGKPTRLIGDSQAERLHWSRDGRWLFLQSSRQVFALAVKGQPGSGIVSLLGGRSRRSLLMVDPSQPAAVVLMENPPTVSRAEKRWRAWRVDVRGRQTLLREDARQFVDFALDSSGRLAWLLRVDFDKHLLLRVDAKGALHEAGRCVQTRRCQLLGASKDGRDAWLHGNVGDNFERLLRIGPDGSKQVLHSDPRGEADLDSVALDPATGEPMVASYRSTVAASHGITPEATRHVEAINRLFPQRDLRFEIGRGANARWLVHDRASTLRGERLHVYDPRTGTTHEILSGLGLQWQGKAVPPAPEATMARKIAFAWHASDGMRLHGFLLVPPGIDVSKAPLVVRVHGGPFSHDRPDFDADAQLLANRGYLVFEPNFRSSTGHGMAYKLAANGDFGNGRVQSDIVEGTSYLLAQGIGDRNRVGIVGASFGGYSTLLGVTFQPDLFKVGIAMVPPGDLGWVLRDYARSDAQWFGIALAVQMKLLGLDPADKALARRLAEQSPIANAAKLRRPVLMLAGGADERVAIRGVTHYAAKLKSLGKDASLLVDEAGGHNSGDIRTREANLYLMEFMLHRHLGGAAPTPPGRVLSDFLARNLRLRGRDFAALPSGNRFTGL
jgi:dipeptidyl aminopeptidase/acylaminoacyl peptidase